MEKTLSAEHARQNWRGMLDDAYRGGEMVIERYGKPIAVVINYDEWQALKQRAGNDEEQVPAK